MISRDDPAAIKASFRKCRVRQMAARTLTALAAMILVAGVVTRTLPSLPVRIALAAAVLTFATYSVLNWRCPACGKLLWRLWGVGPNWWSIQECTHCGVALQD